MATNYEGAPATTTTTIASIRDGAAAPGNESPSSSSTFPSAVVVPDWKRELIERRKSLAKSATPTGEQNNKYPTAVA